jgi:acetate---CoA ligase (ADP-forming)
MTLESFFNPKTVAVVGVSENPNKLGSIIFSNLIEAKYSGELYGINPNLNNQKLWGKICYSSIKDIKEPLDLTVIVIPAQFILPIIDDCIANKTKNISIITAGFSETGNKQLEDKVLKKCRDAEINLLGPNCLGHISTFTNLNASFADGFPAKGKVAFISQSGAFCSAMMDWAKRKRIGFSHFISIGNKAHLSELELLDYIKKDPNTSNFIFYLESLKNGQEFLKILRKVAKTKPVVILEPGKSKKAQSASMSHTGSLAPNYRILEVAYKKAGVIQAYSTREMFGLLEILEFASHKDFDGDIAILTNAGGVGVLASDLCEEHGLNLKKPSEKLIAKLKTILPAEATLSNPIDVVGDAKADRYENSLKLLCKSKEYKNILVLLTPQRITEVLATAKIIINLSKEYTKINIFASFIGGEKVEEGIEELQKNRIIHFDYPTDGIRLLGLLTKQKQNKNFKETKIKLHRVSSKIKNAVLETKEKGLTSLPQDMVNKIMDYYKLDYPKSQNHINKQEALKFCKHFFPNPTVLKLSAPDALHKTEMKGIYLNIDTEEKFNKAWDNLYNSINKFKLKNASILIQEQITNASEIIIGINTDNTFGKVMIFGAGGIYTEVVKDTSLRILPTNEFFEMVKETKIGTILNGVRGEKSKAIKPLVKTLEKIQKLVLELPEIKSIDANPILVTKDRAIVVDFKMILK